MKRWQTIASIIIVFLLGALTGSLVTGTIYRHRVEGVLRGEPGRTEEFIVQRLNSDLHLDKTQLEQLRGIVKETHGELKKLRRTLRPQTEEILARSQERVRAILRPDQREHYEKILAERKKRWESRENRENGR
ncbi:MAG TPA: hypothetical protein VFG09_05795 [Thermodesulfovibrionales bacterium]|nr:hypothetical protein [Thermodesulfovibrionales bacterium]